MRRMALVLITSKFYVFLTKLDISNLIHTFLLKRTQMRNGQGNNGFLGVSLKMWRMHIFIRHNCGERENIVGRRWFIPMLNFTIH